MTTRPIHPRALRRALAVALTSAFVVGVPAYAFADSGPHKAPPGTSKPHRAPSGKTPPKVAKADGGEVDLKALAARYGLSVDRLLKGLVAAKQAGEGGVTASIDAFAAATGVAPAVAKAVVTTLFQDGPGKDAGGPKDPGTAKDRDATKGGEIKKGGAKAGVVVEEDATTTKDSGASRVLGPEGIAVLASTMKVSTQQATEAATALIALADGGHGRIDSDSPEFQAIAAHLGVTPLVLDEGLRAVKQHAGGDDKTGDDKKNGKGVRPGPGPGKTSSAHSTARKA
jgi:hypothetical protein